MKKVTIETLYGVMNNSAGAVLLCQMVARDTSATESQREMAGDILAAWEAKKAVWAARAAWEDAEKAASSAFEYAAHVIESAPIANGEV